MVVGDCETARFVHRLYGAIVSPGGDDTMTRIILADGRIIHREQRYVAVYVHTPANWEELYQAVEVTCERKQYRANMKHREQLPVEEMAYAVG